MKFNILKYFILNDTIKKIIEKIFSVFVLLFNDKSTENTININNGPHKSP